MEVKSQREVIKVLQERHHNGLTENDRKTTECRRTSNMRCSSLIQYSIINYQTDISFLEMKVFTFKETMMILIWEFKMKIANITKWENSEKKLNIMMNYRIKVNTSSTKYHEQHNVKD